MFFNSRRLHHFQTSNSFMSIPAKDIQKFYEKMSVSLVWP